MSLARERSSTRPTRRTAGIATSSVPVERAPSCARRRRSTTTETTRSTPSGGSAPMAERRRLPDQEARDLIEQRLDANLLVEAGAGSGKTESLARRMAAGIAGGVYGIEHMAAVTFTRKAAAELRGRFQIQLERRLAAETNPRRRERLETALARLQ